MTENMAEEGKTVMIVDDSVYLVNKLKTILEKNGLKTIGFTEGHEAVEQYLRLQPDLVTLDIVMPDINGLQVFEELKRLNPTVKVIMVSSIAMKEKIAAAAKLGAKNFILKPFTEEKVMEIINHTLGAAQ